MEKKKNWNPEWNNRHHDWQRANTVKITMNLFKTTDADIIEALDGKQKATEIKRLVRLGMKFDSQSDSHLDETKRN